mmetsp:Transcript_4317/g.4288  ORF Transcript_4317/g.4288 Transcript_4317/m.4288 type:complete len:345 (-) Transcript_4317:612-1646(-)
MSSKHESVFVSGGTGFIAQHLIKLLLSKGYKVVTSVRSREKGERLACNFNSNEFSFEIISAIETKGAFDEALKKHPEVTAFFHTASPVIFETDDVLHDLMLPAVEGTKNLLISLKKYAYQVRKLIVTSSRAAIASHEQYSNPNYIIDEKTYNNITWEDSLVNGLCGYYGSKTFAERAVWDFKRNEYPNFLVSMVMPTFTIGPQAFDSEVSPTLNVTAEYINQLLKLKPTDEIPGNNDSIIDVRDIAKAHVSALELEKAEGERLLIANQRFNFQLIVDILRKKFPDLNNFPTGKPIENFEEEIVNEAAKVNDSRTREILGFHYIPLEQSLVDQVDQILRVRKQNA